MRLSELEFKIFKVIWSVGEKATVQEILDNWTEKNIPKYTTILKTLQILEQKKLADHERIGRSYKYIPLVSKEKALNSSLSDIVKNFFNEDKIAFAETFINKGEFSHNEILDLKKIIEEKEKGINNGQS